MGAHNTLEDIYKASTVPRDVFNHPVRSDGAVDLAGRSEIVIVSDGEGVTLPSPRSLPKGVRVYVINGVQNGGNALSVRWIDSIDGTVTFDDALSSGDASMFITAGSQAYPVWRGVHFAAASTAT